MGDPRTARARWFRNLAAACALAVAAVAPACAQLVVSRPALDPRNIDGTSIGEPVDLGALWLAKQGDDPQWAEPGYDDSGWQVINSNFPLSRQGMKNVNAIWYRTHVRVPASARHLALMFRILMGSDEIFVNGQRLGGLGSLAGQGDDGYADQWMAEIPDAALGTGEITIAVRSRVGLYSHHGDIPTAGISLATVALLGPAPDIRRAMTLQRFRNYTSNTTNLTLILIVLMITLALAVSLRDEREYRFLLLALGCEAAQQSLTLWHLAFGAPYSGSLRFLDYLLQAVSALALIQFTRAVLRIRRSRWISVYCWTLMLWPVLRTISAEYWEPRHPLDNEITVGLRLALQILMAPAVMGLPLLAVWVGWRRKSADGWLLAAPLLVRASYAYYNFGLNLLFMLGLIDGKALVARSQVPIPGFTIAWDEVVSLAFSLAMLVFLVLRTIRLARAKAEAASEMQAVKTLQSLLLARSQQPTPGYSVEMVYRPAAEVGGDFFLVSPGSDGSLVAVVGDVSGKGLLAAMRVSLILGALNRETSRTPAEVLARLNGVLLGQREMGFTTACCVRVEASGDFSFANAGHLNPYIDGLEMEAPGALPLGLNPDEAYATLTGHLEPGQRLVLLSDGVPEARANKELLGFEKLLELTRLGPAEIADAAQQFGQEDDITVLALALAHA